MDAESAQMKLDLNNAVFQNADVDSTKLRRVHKSFFFFFTVIYHLLLFAYIGIRGIVLKEKIY